MLLYFLLSRKNKVVGTGIVVVVLTVERLELLVSSTAKQFG